MDIITRSEALKVVSNSRTYNLIVDFDAMLQLGGLVRLLGSEDVSMAVKRKLLEEKRYSELQAFWCGLRNIQPQPLLTLEVGASPVKSITPRDAFLLVKTGIQEQRDVERLKRQARQDRFRAYKAKPVR